MPGGGTMPAKMRLYILLLYSTGSYNIQYLPICTTPSSNVVDGPALCAAAGRQCGSLATTGECGGDITLNCGTCPVTATYVSYCNAAFKCQPTQCSDGIDNDGDGFVDSAGIAGAASPDPGCSGPDDDDEHGTAQCDDGLDNDGDGFIDYQRSGGDPGCISPTDEDEVDVSVLQICEADCTYVTDTICHADCAGKNGCAFVAPQCDARQVDTFIPIDASTFGVCCSGASQPALADVMYDTDRDRVRATRVQQTTAGMPIIVNIVSFR